MEIIRAPLVNKTTLRMKGVETTLQRGFDFEIGNFYYEKPTVSVF